MFLGSLHPSEFLCIIALVLFGLYCIIQLALVHYYRGGDKNDKKDKKTQK